MKISYSPYARVDVRRMFAEGIIDETEVYKNYREQGYDETRALKLTAYTIKYSTNTQKDLSMSQLIAAYKQGLIKDADAKKALVALKYSEAEADFMLESAAYAEFLKDQKEIVDVIQDQYEAKIIDVEQARNLLNQAGVTTEKIELYTRKWETAREKTRRRPTIEQLNQSCAYGIITPEEYMYELTELGYGARHVNMLTQLLIANIEAGAYA